MPLRHAVGDPNHALNINQRLAQLSGYGAVDGGFPSRGARPFVLDFTDATVHIDGDEIELPATSVDLTDEVHPELPRKAVVYITPTHDDDPGAEYRYALGKPKKARPRGKTQFETYEPSPPDLGHIEAAPVAEVWLGADVQQIRRSDIKDRRLSANVKAYSIEAVIGSFDTFIDGAGVEHSEGLGSGELEWSESDVLDAINSYEGHATNAYHNYFSGLHGDLSDVGESDHHVRYDDGRARDAMTELDAADLGAASASTPGQHLAVLGETSGGDDSSSDTLIVSSGETYSVYSNNTQTYSKTIIESGGTLDQRSGSTLQTTGEPLLQVQNVGEDAVWKDPPMAEAPVLETGTVLHTGGSSTVVQIDGVSPVHYPSMEIGVSTSVDSEPSWSQSYGYSTSESYRNDSDSESVTVEIELSWDIDPGSGNDLPIRYTIYDLNGNAVSSLYDDSDVANAVSDHDLSLTGLDATHRFIGPIRDTLPPTGSAEIGDTVIATGNGEASFGPYQFNGSGWDGPYGPGVTSLLDLDIDASRNWDSYRIRNVGAPEAMTDAIRRADIEDHANDENAHHSPTTSSDIDHAAVSNVQPHQHHTPPDDDDIVDALAGKVITTALTTARIPDSDASNVHVNVAWDETFHLVRSEFYNEDGETPSGLRLKVIDLDNGSAEYESWLWVEEGSRDDPLVSIDGSRDLAIRLHNDTGTEQIAGGSASYMLTRG